MYVNSAHCRGDDAEACEKCRHRLTLASRDGDARHSAAPGGDDTMTTLATAHDRAVGGEVRSSYIHSPTK